jgi:hypothetical protein
MNHKSRIFYTMSCYEMWFNKRKRKWEAECNPPCSSTQYFRTAKKAFRAFDKAPKGTLLTRYLKRLKTGGYLVQDWEK